MKRPEITQKTTAYFQEFFPELFHQKEPSLSEFKDFLVSRIQNIEALFLHPVSIPVEWAQLETSELKDVETTEVGRIQSTEYNADAGNEVFEEAHRAMIDGYTFSYYDYLSAIYNDTKADSDTELADIHFEFLDFVLEQKDNFDLFGTNAELSEDDERTHNNTKLHEFMKERLEHFKETIHDVVSTNL